MVRRTGAHFFVLELSWSAAEPSPRRYSVEEITRAARLLRQSGAVLHLDLPLVHRDRARRAGGSGARRVRRSEALPPARRAPRRAAAGPSAISRRCRSATPPTRTSPTSPRSCGRIRRLFDGAVSFSKKKAPRSARRRRRRRRRWKARRPEVAAALHAAQPAPPLHVRALRPGIALRAARSRSLEKDWRVLLGGAGGRPIAFPLRQLLLVRRERLEPARQAEFVRRFRDFPGEGGRPGAAVRPLGGAARRAPETEPAPSEGRARRPSGAAARFSRTAAFRISTASPSRPGASGSAIRGL